MGASVARPGTSWLSATHTPASPSQEAPILRTRISVGYRTGADRMGIWGTLRRGVGGTPGGMFCTPWRR
ncbi:hypothetical protein TO73_2416 [Thermus aquaticus Y51MC23]|uniref:Uncharacterized protein n=1 Tax=Thermus aquaticus (strain ATCC BAA-2747 / Y51MC23) TaxID=498848 RepID=A0ABN4IM50_THEA5|nr:hypothetical protein TO73_2416 [Thermus aquaticus Y51MC23]